MSRREAGVARGDAVYAWTRAPRATKTRATVRWESVSTHQLLAKQGVGVSWYSYVLCLPIPPYPAIPTVLPCQSLIPPTPSSAEPPQRWSRCQSRIWKERRVSPSTDASSHSAIGGPWMPDDVVMGMVVDLKIGLETSLSTPAERRWMNLRLVGDEAGCG